MSWKSSYPLMLHDSGPSILQEGKSNGSLSINTPSSHWLVLTTHSSSHAHVSSSNDNTDCPLAIVSHQGVSHDSPSFSTEKFSFTIKSSPSVLCFSNHLEISSLVYEVI